MIRVAARQHGGRWGPKGRLKRLGGVSWRHVLRPVVSVMGIPEAGTPPRARAVARAWIRGTGLGLAAHDMDRSYVQMRVDGAMTSQYRPHQRYF
ncbi:hypothetical protein ACLOJK_020199 [Asimina triloba]